VLLYNQVFGEKFLRQLALISSNFDTYCRPHPGHPKLESLSLSLSTANLLHFLSESGSERKTLIDVWRADRLGELNFVGLAVRETLHNAARRYILIARLGGSDCSNINHLYRLEERRRILRRHHSLLARVSTLRPAIYSYRGATEHRTESDKFVRRQRRTHL